MGCGTDEIIEPITIQNMSTRDYLKYLDWCKKQDTGLATRSIDKSVRREFGEFKSIDDWIENINRNRAFIDKYSRDVKECQCDATKPNFGQHTVSRYYVMAVKANGSRVATHFVAVKKHVSYPADNQFIRDVAYSSVHGEMPGFDCGTRGIVLPVSSVFDSVYKVEHIVTAYSRGDLAQWRIARDRYQRTAASRHA